MAKQCGFNSIQHTLPEDTSQDDLMALVALLNADPDVDGILVQLPLPKHLDSDTVSQSTLPEKDVDGLHIINAGKLATGDLKTGLLSCTPAGAMILVRQIHGKDLSGLNALVIGRSNLFGKPMRSSSSTPTLPSPSAIRVAVICRNSPVRRISWSPPSAVPRWSRPTV